MEPVMSKDEFRLCIKVLKSVYTGRDFIPTEESGAIWYRMLCDIPYKVMEQAIKIHILSSSFPPTIKELREAALKASGKSEQISDMDAWAMVRKAIGRASYYAKEEFDKLPEAVQKAVGDPGNLKAWATMDTTAVDSVIHSNFLRSYKVVLERQKSDLLLGSSVLQLVEQTAKQLNG